MSKSAISYTDLIPDATLSMTNQDSDYPIANAQDEDPINVAKSTTTSTVVTITVPSSTPLLYSVINTNATSIALTNGAGMASQALTIPSRLSDGQCMNGWKNLTGVASSTSTTFTLTMSKTGTKVLEFGEIILATDLRDLNWIVSMGEGPEYTWDYDAEVIRTGRKSRRVYDYGVRIRSARGRVRKDADRVTLLGLANYTKGLVRPFLFIPDQAVNDAWYVVHQQTTVSHLREVPNLSTMSLAMTELSMGLPPALT